MAVSDLLVRAGELSKDEELALIKRVMLKEQQAPKAEDVVVKKIDVEPLECLGRKTS